LDPGFDSLGGVGVFIRSRFDPRRFEAGFGLDPRFDPPSSDAGFDPLGTTVRLGQGSIPRFGLILDSIHFDRSGLDLPSLALGAIHPSLAVGSNPSGSWVRSPDPDWVPRVHT